jgi:UDP-N-acetylmuramate--alanine ligase
LDRKILYKHLGIYGLFLALILVFTFLWLKLYTNHNQKIKIENFKNKTVEEVINIANKHDFKVVIIDSTFIIGQEGGIVLNQNPKPGSMVKENRSIYLTVSKYNADKLKLSELPKLYGDDYDQKSKELGLRGIFTRIIGKKYDAGEPNHILEVYYKNRLVSSSNIDAGDAEINKGDYLDIIVSSKEEGDIIVPDIVCRNLEEASFLLDQSNLTFGEIIGKGVITDSMTAFIILQDPIADGISKVPINSGIQVTIVQNKPSKCN